MGDVLEQNTCTITEDISEETTGVPSSVDKNKIIYFFLFMYLLISVLSVEGLVCWSIGIIGSYKTIKIYRYEQENKLCSAIKLLICSVLIALAYNIAVNYVTNILNSKLV